MLNLAGKRILVCGPQGSGKSVVGMEIARGFATSRIAAADADDWRDLPAGHVIDLMPRSIVGDEDKCRAWIERVARRATRGPKSATCDLWLIDEANQFLPARKPLPPTVGWISNTARHMETPNGKSLAWLLITRRPVTLQTDLVELAHEALIFRLAGRNDLRLCDDLHSGLADVVARLEPFHFVRRSSTGEIVVHKPVRLPPGR